MRMEEERGVFDGRGKMEEGRGKMLVPFPH